MNRSTHRWIDAALAAALAALAFTAAALMACHVTERLPHLEDEITYLFQARTYARGALWAPPPPSESGFYVPFTLTLDGRWIGKYAIGWPLVLALGERVDAGWLVNPVLGALTVTLIYLLGRDLYGRQIGALAGVLALTSPFFLIQSSTFMSHAAGALWAALLAWAWLRIDMAQAAGKHRHGWAALGGLAAGMLVLTRPMTAVAVGLPFAAVLMARAARDPRGIPHLFSQYWPFALVAALVTALQPAYLYAVTGSPTTNLYTLIWPYDRLGFGPGTGPYGGHTLRQGLITTRQELTRWASDLFGWPHASWIAALAGLVPAGLHAARSGRREWPWLLAGPFAALVIIHIAYWVGAHVYGPRYFYEAHAGLAILAALGLRALAGLIFGKKGGWRARVLPSGERLCEAWPVYPLLAALIVLTISVYLPARLDDWRALYGFTRAPLEQLDDLRQTDRVLVLVRGSRWVDYGAFFALNSPWLDDPIIAAHDLSPGLAAQVIGLYPDREVWYYANGIFTRTPFPYEEVPGE